MLVYQSVCHSDDIKSYILPCKPRFNHSCWVPFFSLEKRGSGKLRSRRRRKKGRRRRSAKKVGADCLVSPSNMAILWDFLRKLGFITNRYGDIMIAHYWILHDCWFGSRTLRRNCSSDGRSGLWFRLVLGVLGLYWYFNSLPWNITVFQWIIPRWQFSITEHIPISLALSGKVKAVAEEAGWLDLKWRFSMVA